MRWPNPRRCPAPRSCSTRRRYPSRPDGELTLADGRTIKADLIVAADGANSQLRDSLGLLAKRKYLVDGCTRLLIDKTPEEMGSDGATTVEYWSGSRRVLYTPCSETEVYIALTMLDSDEAAKEMPVDRDAWKRWFPHLEPLIGRIRAAGRYDRFEYIKLKRWSAGKVAVIGDAAHAIPPNIGQGGGCAMMNALSLAVYLDRDHDTAAALATWEQKRARHHRAHPADFADAGLADDLAAVRSAPRRWRWPANRSGWFASARRRRCTFRRGRKSIPQSATRVMPGLDGHPRGADAVGDAQSSTDCRSARQ